MLRQRIHCGLVLLSALVFLYPVSILAMVVDQVVVVIDAEPYTLSNIKEYAKTKMKREFPAGDLNQIGKEDQQVLEEFITEKLLEAEVRQAGIQVSEAEIDSYVGKIKEKNRLSDDDLKEILKREGMTLQDYRAKIRDEIEKNDIINRQVREKVNITSEDVERYYRQNSKKYMTGERIRLRHILLPLPEGAAPEREQEVKLRAMELRQRALGKEDFGQLARRYSEGAGASQGGEIGWVQRGSLLKEIEEVAFKDLAVGEISQPVRTSMGFHILQLEAKEEARPLPLAQVRSKIKEELYAKAMEERFQGWLRSDLRKRHRVDVKLPGVVFRPEEKKDGTVNSLMASSARRRRKEEPGFLSYLNPFSYIVSETPVEGDDYEGPPSGQNVVKVLGVPLFTTADDDAADVPVLIEEDKAKDGAGKSEGSGGFFSSVWKTLNPFSK